MYLNLQNDLGSISNEIISLQKRSVSMSVQLSNRQVLKGPLASFIEDIAVSEIMILYVHILRLLYYANKTCNDRLSSDK